jgi:hypothetical protein
MTAVWPSALPAPLRADLSRSFIDTRVRKQADGGPPAYRRRYSLMPISYRLSVAVDQDGLQAFDRFYVVTLKNGILPFVMDQPELVGAVLRDESGRPVLDDAGRQIRLDIGSVFAMGDGMPITVPWGTGFKISFDAILLP